MENVNEENKVVEYEIITTKKYRQVVKVQFDEKYSDELDETKITPSDIDFGLGNEIEGDETQTFSTKVVNEPPEKFMTYISYEWKIEPILRWGKVVPQGTKSVLYYENRGSRGQYRNPITIYFSCPHTLVVELWSNSKIKELNSHILGCGKLKEHFDTHLDCLKTIYKKRTGSQVNIIVSDVGFYHEDRDISVIGFDSDETKYIILNYCGRSRKEQIEWMKTDEYKELQKRIESWNNE